MGLRVKDRGLTKIMKALRGQDLVAKVGIQGSQGEAFAGGASNVVIGAVHEFGSPVNNVPSRSFLRSTMDEQQRKYYTMVLRGVRLVTDSKGLESMKRVMGLTAEMMKSDIQTKISSNLPPPLSPAYARRRLKRGTGTNTLVETGQLLGAITAKVESK